MENLLKDLFDRDKDIDLWEIPFPLMAQYEKEFYEILDEREKIRTSKFVFPHLTTRYTIGHGSLRILLGRYTGMDPKEITFHSRVRGKPYLAINPHQLEFNYSDSHEKGLFGLSIQDEIGVDIEKIDPNILTKGLEKSVFTEKELKEFYSHPNKIEAFYCGWTQKEAMLKLLGTGLYLDLNKIEVPLHVSEEPLIVRYNDKEHYVRSFLLANEYYVAIASYKPNFDITKRVFEL